MNSPGKIKIEWTWEEWQRSRKARRAVTDRITPSSVRRDWTVNVNHHGQTSTRKNCPECQITLRYLQLNEWAAGLSSQLDGYTITLNNGDTARVNFEAASVPDGGASLAMLAVAVAAMLGMRRRKN